jgi:hypothetical protein
MEGAKLRCGTGERSYEAPVGWDLPVDAPQTKNLISWRLHGRRGGKARQATNLQLTFAFRSLSAPSASKSALSQASHEMKPFFARFTPGLNWQIPYRPRPSSLSVRHAGLNGPAQDEYTGIARPLFLFFSLSCFLSASVCLALLHIPPSPPTKGVSAHHLRVEFDFPVPERSSSSEAADICADIPSDTPHQLQPDPRLPRPPLSPNQAGLGPTDSGAGDGSGHSALPPASRVG